MSLKRWLRLQGLRLAGRATRLLGRGRGRAPAAMRSILVLRPDHLGDVLLSRPAIGSLTRALPQARVVVAVGPWGRPALGTHAGFDLLVARFPGFSREQGRRDHAYRRLLALAYRLRRRGGFDAALILRPDHWWGAWLAALAGIPIRIGYATPETSPFLTHALPWNQQVHAARESLALVEVLLGMSGVAAPSLPSVTTFSDDVAVALLLRQAGLESTPYLVLHPGSGSPLKSWPREHFAQAARALLDGRLAGARVVVTGSAAEAAAAEDLRALLPAGSLTLAGKLQWGELEAVLRRATLVVGVDSGPLHLAVAAGTPSVALFGAADPVRFGPWGDADRHRVVAADLPCRPCRRLDFCRLQPGRAGPPPCMRAITVAAVLEACDLALAGRPS